MKYNCIVVDDEQLAIDVIVKYIGFIDGLELKATCKNAVEAFNILQNERIDLIFLDVNMPLLSGLEFVKNLTNPPAVIFTTAYRDYAVESYNLKAIDYIVKPIPFERFLQAVNRFFESVKASAMVVPKNQMPHAEEENENFIFVKSDKKMVKILLKEILWIESMRNYVVIVTTEKKTTVYKSLSSIEEKLPSTGFLRINRSTIIAINYIEEFNMAQIKIKGQWFTIGGNYKSEVLKFLQNFID